MFRFAKTFVLCVALAAFAAMALPGKTALAEGKPRPGHAVASSYRGPIRPPATRAVTGAANVETGLQPRAGQHFPTRVRVANGVTIAAGATSTVKVTGVGSVPASGVSAIAINIAADGSGGAGGLIVYPSDLAAAPGVTGVGYRSNVWEDQLLTIRCGPDGQIKIKNTGSVSAKIYADVQGYQTAAGAATAGATYVPLNTAPVLNKVSI